MMYKTAAQTASDIKMPLHQVIRYIHDGRIKAVHDGEQYLINSTQFSAYYEQLERIKEEIDIWKSTPIPPDIDIKDED